MPVSKTDLILIRMRKGWLPVAMFALFGAFWGSQQAGAFDDFGSGSFGPEFREEEYRIQQGDTLWRLSEQFFGDPFAWPTLWSLNPHVTNPNWIYPGDALRIVPLQAAIAVDEPEYRPVEEAPPPEEPLVSDYGDTTTGARLRSMPRPWEVQYFVRYGGFITEDELEHAGRIAASWEEKIYLAEFDEVYVEFERLPSIRPSDRWTVASQPRPVKHPITGEQVGYQVDVHGVVEITSVEEHLAKGILVRTYREVERNALVLPLLPIFRNVRPRQNTQDLDAHIISAATEAKNLGPDDTVYLDRGARHGVELGNRFDVVRQGDGINNLPADEVANLPKEDVGQIIVVETRDFQSTGLIIYANREILVGDACRMVSGR